MPGWSIVLIIVVLVAAALFALAWWSSGRKRPEDSLHVEELETEKEERIRSEMRRSGSDGPGGMGSGLG
jgi:beta-lactam-binding protein with PASTA domain